MKNKNLKNLIIPMIIITILTSIIITIITYNQYKKLTIILNEKIAEIVGVIKQTNPEVDSREIIEVLNKNAKGNSFETGKDILFQYGIKIDKINSIVSI